jgi:hypothetical protein
MFATVTAQSKIRGVVRDIHGSPIAAATVLLLNSTDSILVKGTVTNSTGNYYFDNIGAGKYFITSSSVGFLPGSIGIFPVNSNNEEIDHGVIELEPLPASLANVTVTAKRPLYELKADRLTINVENSITASGSTALQVLERSPGVSVNRQSGTIAMLGKDGVRILINGKLSYLPPSAIAQMLDGMSADNIEKIELITTPPANFDAEGKAGYINIILKQNNNIGTNGSYSGTVGYGKGWVTQGNLDFNHRKGRINIYGNFSYARVKNLFPSTGYSRISNNGSVYEIDTRTDRIDTTRTPSVRLGLDYQLSRRTVFGLLLTANGRWYRQSEHTASSYRLNGNIDTLVNNFNSELNDWRDYGVNLNLQHSFVKDGTLSFNAYYLRYKNNQPVNYNARYYDKSGNWVYDESTRSGKRTPMKFWVGAVDYSKKLTKKIDLEAGLKGTIADFTNDLDLERFGQGNWIKDPSRSSVYYLKENYCAAYVSLNITANEKTTVKGGLRYEYTNSNLGSETVKNIVDRHYGKLFPTFFLSRRLNEASTLSLSYVSRITRPTFENLAPFTYYTNRNSLLTGNPALQPAIAHEIKAGYTFKKYFAEISFTRENNAITFFQPTVDSTTNTTISKSENLISQNLYSALVSVPVTVTPWWSMQYSVTGVFQQVNAKYQDAPIRLNRAFVMINMTQNVTLPKDFSIELTGNYNSPVLDGIMQFKAFGMLNFGVKKKLGARDAINLNGSNLLNSMDMRGSVDLPEQNVVGYIKLRPMWRTYKLTFTHRFGKEKLKSTRERTTGAEDLKSRFQ